MSQQPSLDTYDDALLRDLYRTMRLIREFEDTREDLVEAGEVLRHAHLYQGQEAIAAGACLALNDDDIIASTHRCTGHVLAKGADPAAMMAEFGGRTAGLCGGRGGEMHLFDPENGIMESTAMVGGNAPHIAGAMLASELDDDQRVGVSFFGDGAVNQGVTAETMNLAKVWELPVLFICENNQYAVTMGVDRSTAGDAIIDRAAAHNIPAHSIDGQDALAVYETVSTAVEEIRDGSGPQFIECETYRYTGHHSSEDQMLGDEAYRSNEEIESWKERDPLTTFAATVQESGRLTATDLDAIDDAVEETIDDAIAFLRDGEFPSAERALEDVYADQDYEHTPAGRYR